MTVTSHEEIHFPSGFPVDKGDPRFFPVSFEVREMGDMGRFDCQGYTHTGHTDNDQMNVIFRVFANSSPVQREIMNRAVTFRTAFYHNPSSPDLIEIERSKFDVLFDLLTDIRNLKYRKSTLIFE